MTEITKTKTSLTIRIESDTLKAIDNICSEESEKTGFGIDRSDVVRKAISDYIKQYHSKNKAVKSKKD